MSEDDLVRRLQVGHDSGCAMSYGMHEHCCDCSYPDRQESAETILKLRQDLASANEKLRAFEHYVMTGRNEQHDRLVADLEAARADNAALEVELAAAREQERHHDETMADTSITVRTLRQDLAAARAALRELIGMIEIAAVMPDAINKHMRVDWDDPVLQRARAALAGEKK